MRMHTLLLLLQRECIDTVYVTHDEYTHIHTTCVYNTWHVVYFRRFSSTRHDLSHVRDILSVTLYGSLHAA